MDHVWFKLIMTSDGNPVPLGQILDFTTFLTGTSDVPQYFQFFSFQHLVQMQVYLTSNVCVVCNLLQPMTCEQK